MDEEASGLNIIFICILACILFLTYSVIPSDPSVKEISEVSTHKNKVEIIASESGHTKAAQKTPPADLHVEPAAETEASDEPGSPSAVEEAAEHSKVVATIAMNNPAYETHKKGIVIFTHQKHIDEYKIECGQCHHDDTGEPLTLTYEDSVDSCIDCHTETKKESDEKLDKTEKIAKYHFEALHANCIGCHKTFNKENGDPKGKSPAPTSCAKCHPKK